MGEASLYVLGSHRYLAKIGFLVREWLNRSLSLGAGENALQTLSFISRT